MIKRFLNLTSGLESIEELDDFSFIRIQSTQCERHLWNYIILDLDNNFLMSVALGYECVVYDYSRKDRIPRAVRQGLEFVKYCLYRAWLQEEYLADMGMSAYFKKEYKNLPERTKRKLKYYCKFNPKYVRIKSETRTSEYVDNYEYYSDLVECEREYRKSLR